MIVNEKYIKVFLEKHNYDVRLTGNARWIDQKCTPDVVSIIADCVLNYYLIKPTETFTSRDIWFSEYSVQNVQDVFRKVDVNATSVKNEYDKFFQQPMKMLAYAGILVETKNRIENIYKVIDCELLEFLSIREKNALLFLNLYIEKVLRDSGLWPQFESFFENQTKQYYEFVKEAFSNFTIKYTKIGNKTSQGGVNDEAGVVETRRIFIKVINPLAYSRSARGTEKGQLSKHKITYDMLMYNRDNFRDIYAEKPKDVSRKDYIAQKKIKINPAYYSYLSEKAKRELRRFNDIFRNKKSEMPGDASEATTIHHIFPKEDYLEISYYLENLIALTPNQHYNQAHNGFKTKSISKEFQECCLLVKADSIRENIESILEEVVYSFDGFKTVLTVGLSDDSYQDVEDGDYEGIKAKIKLSYA